MNPSWLSLKNRNDRESADTIILSCCVRFIWRRVCLLEFGGTGLLCLIVAIEKVDSYARCEMRDKSKECLASRTGAGFGDCID
jgi:hypothetical protein